MPQTEPAAEAVGLSKAFGHHVVFRGIDLQMASGRAVALTGANGAGKTTLLRCLSAVIRPTSGQVRWFGRAAAARPAARLLVGMVAHESALYPQLTLHENLTFAARMCNVSGPAKAAQRWLDDVGLGLHADRFPGQVSRGMRQRVAVARALIHDPSILFLDEPFSSLDREGIAWLLEVLFRLRDRGRTICFVTHDEAITQALADEVIELRPDGIRSRAGEPSAREGQSPIQTRAA